MFGKICCVPPMNVIWRNGRSLRWSKIYLSPKNKLQIKLNKKEWVMKRKITSLIVSEEFHLISTTS